MKCPSCFRPLEPNRFTWLITSGPTDVDPEASRYAGFEVRNQGTITLRRPDDARRGWQPDPRMVKSDLAGPVHPACPVCHFRLPEDIRSSTVTCIAMSGARATGKSLYIAVVIKQLRRLAQSLGTVLDPADDRTRATYAGVYERPLYEERGLLEPTLPLGVRDAYQRFPLVWSLGMVQGRRQYIAIRDVAGEDMEAPPADAGALSFLQFADSVLFMFDPLAVPAVRDKLKDLVPAQSVGGRPQDVLANLTRLIGNASPRIAVVLSKFDALQALVDVEDVTWRTIMSNTGAAFLRDTSEIDPRYDEADGELLSEEVRSLLIQLGAQDIVLALQNPSSGRRLDYRFFAVSVLGAAPEGRRLNQRGITPFRCLDPLKWTLRAQRVLA